MSLVGEVTLKGLQEEGSSLLNVGVLKEDLDYLINRCLWVALGISHGDHLSKLDGSSRVGGNNSSQDLHEVGLVVRLLAVGDDLVELVGFNKSLDDLVGGAGSLVYLQGELGVELSDDIAELVRHREFTLGDPVLNKVRLTLLKDGSGKLN